MLSRFFVRPQARVPWPTVIVAGAAGVFTIGVLGLLDAFTALPVIIAGFGSSCVLVFTLPDSPLSQPANVIGGHLTSALSGLLVSAVLPVSWWSMAIAVGLAISSMAALRITHPPAGGNPIAVMLAGAGWSYLLTPILLGAVIVVIFSLLHRRLVSATAARAEKRSHGSADVPRGGACPARSRQLPRGAVARRRNDAATLRSGSDRNL